MSTELYVDRISELQDEIKELEVKNEGLERGILAQDAITNQYVARIKELESALAAAQEREAMLNRLVADLQQQLEEMAAERNANRQECERLHLAAGNNAMPAPFVIIDRVGDKATYRPELFAESAAEGERILNEWVAEDIAAAHAEKRKD